ncbi:MAG: DUF1491 family protein [Pseudomonadota bacterium]
MTIRLPTHLEIGSLIRLAETHGGSAMVISKGERDAGTILLVTMFRGQDARLFERMPQLDGSRAFVPTKTQDSEKPWEFSDYLDRRGRQDPDTWILEIDIEDPERFIALLPN